MNKEEKQKIHDILELGKHHENLHHKKGFGGLNFIDLSMIKFSKLNSYILKLEQELNQKNKIIEEIKNNLKNATKEEIIEDLCCDIGELEYRINKAIELLDKLNIQLKDVLKTGINIKEISDIKEILKGEDKE